MVHRFLHSLHLLLRSTRLFLVLAAVTVLFIAIPTVIPELSNAVYRGPVLVALGVLLEANLVACTAPRLVRRVRSGERRLSRYGPDVIHVGLAVAIIAAVLTSALRTEARYVVPTGEAVTHAGMQLTVVNSAEIRNDRGEVVDWRITLLADGQRYLLSLNRPIRIGPHKAHFFHWGTEPVAVFTADGSRYVVRLGEGLQADDGVRFLLTRIDPAGEVTFTAVDPEGRSRGSRDIGVGERFAGLTLERTTEHVFNGFVLSRDPGRPVLLAALLLIGAGFLLYSLRFWRVNG